MPEASRRSEKEEPRREVKGTMTVQEAGHKGGQRVKELIEEGKEAEGKGPRSKK